MIELWGAGSILALIIIACLQLSESKYGTAGCLILAIGVLAALIRENSNKIWFSAHLFVPSHPIWNKCIQEKRRWKPSDGCST